MRECVLLPPPLIPFISIHYLHTYIHTYIQTDRHTYIQTYMYMYVYASGSD